MHSLYFGTWNSLLPIISLIKSHAFYQLDAAKIEDAVTSQLINAATTKTKTKIRRLWGN